MESGPSNTVAIELDRLAKTKGRIVDSQVRAAVTRSKSGMKRWVDLFIGMRQTAGGKRFVQRRAPIGARWF